VETSEIRNYCNECGIRIRKSSWKFCPECGNEIKEETYEEQLKSPPVTLVLQQVSISSC
jgi:rRNA maturation endonuclease Nob1